MIHAETVQPIDASLPERGILRRVGLGPILFVVVLIVLAIVGPLIVPYNPLTASADTLKPPSAAHWFGTDQIGRDIFSRVIVATKLDLSIAFSSVCVAFVLGTVIGSLAGYFGGTVDRIIGRMTETIMAFPLFVLAMGIVAALGNSVPNIVYATIIINLPFYIRFARAEVGARRNLPYVDSARANGNGDLRIIGFHLVPNILPSMSVQVSLNMGWAIMNAAALSFIGLGIRPPTPEWGIMVFEGSVNLASGQWWTFVFPGVALMLAIACFDMFGEKLRNALDPRRAQ
jgi:peptide/nickel transport system permease protein